MDYKNTPEGRAVQSKYGKILHASRPEPPHNHPRMPMSNRARAIFPLVKLNFFLLHRTLMRELQLKYSSLFLPSKYFSFKLYCFCR